MKQIAIKQLLEEAALEKTTESRIVEILDQFGEAIIHSYEISVSGEAARVGCHKLLIHNLFEQASVSKSLFPHLFPTIAALCGDREYGNLPAKINLSLLNDFFETVRVDYLFIPDEK